MSSGILRSVWRFSYAGILERVFFALDKRFEIKSGGVAVFEGIGAQTVERRLC